MCLRRPRLLTQHKPRPNPHRTRPQHQRRRQTLPIKQPSRRNNLHLIPRHGTLLPLNHLHHCGYQDRSGHVACMPTSLAALRTDHIGADVETFLDVFRVPDHVHVEDTGFVEAFDDGFGGDTDGGDEELGAGVDDYCY